MDARTKILADAGGSGPGAPPRWQGPALHFDDPVAAFRESLEAAGGTLVVSADEPEVPFLLGGPAVAECGAVWWVPRSEAERREAFLAEHMVLRVDASQLVHNLHEAYARIRETPPYACFVSGPSKTADIEQALVIGAHGPKHLEVWLVPSVAAASRPGKNTGG